MATRRTWVLHSIDRWIAYVKTANTDSGHVELFGSTTGSDYFNPNGTQSVLPIDPSDVVNGHFQITNGQMYFLKVNNTGTNSVEIHRAASQDYYTQWNLETGTCFTTTKDHQFSIDAGELCDIDLSNPGDPKTSYKRILFSTAKSPFQWSTQYYSPFFGSATYEGQFFVRNGSIYWIKTKDLYNAGGTIAVWRSERTEEWDESPPTSTLWKAYQHQYKQLSQVSQTPLPFSVSQTGYFDMTVEGDLHFFRTTHCASGHIEVHTMLASENYQKVYQTITSFVPSDALSGTFICATSGEGYTSKW